MQRQDEDTIRADCRSYNWLEIVSMNKTGAFFPLGNIEFENEVIISPQGLPLAYAPGSCDWLNV